MKGGIKCLHSSTIRSMLLRIFRHGFVNGFAVTSKNEYNCKDVRTGGGLNAKIYCRRGFKIQSKKILDWDRWIFNFFGIVKAKSIYYCINVWCFNKGILLKLHFSCIVSSIHPRLPQWLLRVNIFLLVSKNRNSYTDINLGLEMVVC